MVDKLLEEALSAPTWGARSEATRRLGDVAGRANDAAWEDAERAAWALLDLARRADAAAERRALLLAMGRGFRNQWLLPYVHSRLVDEDASIVEAAVVAAGGLGFPALEEAVARFLDDDAPPRLRRAALASLGRMGAMSQAARVASFVDAAPAEAAVALGALTEMRSPAGIDLAVQRLARDPTRAVRVAAMHYLAEMGRDEVVPTLRQLARDDDPELRRAASLAARALERERHRDAGERILSALTERDRAVRALLARRLRTLPVADVLGEAEVLLADDAAGVVQIVGEVRAPEVTRFLLGLAGRADLPPMVRARAALAIEANEAWEREALAEVALADGDESVRVAAAQTLGAFASLEELVRRLGSLAGAASPALRGAWLWAVQLAARPPLEAEGRQRLEADLRRALSDDDAAVRRRAAFVAGNLQLDGLAPALVDLAKRSQRADLRVAAFVGLGELLGPTTFAEALSVLRREEDPQALVAASRALAAALPRAPERPDLAPLAGKLRHLGRSPDATVREAAVRLAGFAGGAVPAAELVAFAADPAPRVREEAIAALGRLASPDGEPALLAALEGPDPALRERAAEALLALGGRRALERLLAWVSGEDEPEARARIAARLRLPAVDGAHFRPLLDQALARVGPEDAAAEALLARKVELLEESAGKGGDAGRIETAIVAAFPTWTKLSRARGFDPLAKSLRTAEALYQTAAALADADLSPPIVLWMKCLEGYVHAWLSRKLEALQRHPSSLYNLVDDLVGSWSAYQRYVAERWTDPVEMGATRVEVPVRALVNALREFQERRVKYLDSPLSVTEWARMLVFFGVDHPSGARNVFRLTARAPEQVVRLAHRLHTLAAVRNVVTHRASAGGATLEAFRRSYYATFEELTGLA